MSELLQTIPPDQADDLLEKVLMYFRTASLPELARFLGAAAAAGWGSKVVRDSVRVRMREQTRDVQDAYLDGMIAQGGEKPEFD